MTPISSILRASATLRYVIGKNTQGAWADYLSKSGRIMLLNFQDFPLLQNDFSRREL